MSRAFVDASVISFVWKENCPRLEYNAMITMIDLLGIDSPPLLTSSWSSLINMACELFNFMSLDILSQRYCKSIIGN